MDQLGSRAVLEGVETGASPRVAQDLAAARAHLDWLENGNISGPNRMMLDRIGEANVSQRELTIAERNFLIHETFEARLVEAGMDQLSAHQLSLQKHPLFANYDPVVIQSFPEWFGPGWRLYWNLG